MKKLVFLFVAFAAVSFASCGNKAANTESTVDSTVVEEAAPVVDDSTAVDSPIPQFAFPIVKRTLLHLPMHTAS